MMDWSLVRPSRRSGTGKRRRVYFGAHQRMRRVEAMALDSAPGALDGLRVLDLAGPMGAYCGRLFAGLGADVLRVEPPGGDVTRQLPPFYHDEPGIERSLFYWHFNVNKRGITLNLDTTGGQQLFRRLAETADVVIETFHPGYLSSLGLGYEKLEAINPGLILASIT